jgi:formate dehydrogenase subunit gamma
MDAATVLQIIAQRSQKPGPMLPILHDIQDRFGFIPDDAIPMIATGLNVSRAEVHGVITYYPHFRSQPAGRHLVQVCRAEACQARGGEELAAHAVRKLGCGFHETTADGAYTLEPTYCFGHCAVGPNIAIDQDHYARVQPVRFDQLIAQLGESA